jgi:6-phosphogluconolactonase
MSTIDLQQFASPETLAERVAANWIISIRSANRAGRRQVIALSGGRIAGNFLAATARLALAGKVSLNQVVFFWGDERCVPADHPDSNFQLAKENLFDPLGIRADQLHPLCCDDDGQSTALRMSLELQRLADRDAAGVPVFDLVFLGMGEDAHVASLFPEEPEAVRDLPDIYRPVTATKPPPRRITLGYHVIAAAREVWVLASGAGKAGALEESLRPDANTPLARVIRSRRITRIFTDI